MAKGFDGPPWPSGRTNFDRNLAILIGIDQYKSNHIANLGTPVSDAEALATLLERDFFNQPEDDVIRLFQPHAEPTLRELQTLLTDTLPNKLKPGRGDRLIVYFAGHGLPLNSDDGPAGYLVPQDADLGNPESLLSMQAVYESLSQLQCHHLLVILDCCFAGRFRWATSRKLLSALSTIHREHYDRFIRYPAWQVITSAAHDQEALDAVKLSADQRGTTPNRQHSPFALALLEALGEGAPDKKAVRYKNADYTRDGVVTAHELLVYLQHRVSELSQEQQAPGLYPLRREFDKGEFIFTTTNFDAHSLQPAPVLNEDNNPYRGLNPFDERHAQFFFGRETLVNELIEKLNQPDQVLTTVLGVSGSGKSSLVRAGLTYQLRQPESKGWKILDPFRLGESPFRALARVLLPIAAPGLIQRVRALTTLDQQLNQMVEQHQPSHKLNQPSPVEQSGLTIALVWANASPGAKLLLLLDYRQEISSFLENNISSEEKEKVERLIQETESSLDKITSNLQNNPQALRETVQVWHQNAVGEKILLVIDQFEELITLTPEASVTSEADTTVPSPHQGDKLPFLSLLQEAVTHCTDSLRIVVTLRSDFEPRFLESPLQPSWKNSRFPIRAMTSDELRQAIEGPALKQALYFEPESLVGQLVDEVGQMPGALPLLSFTLSELYIKLFERWKVDEITGRALRLEDYEELGGVAGALTQRATAIYEALDERAKATMQRVMLRMVTIEGGGLARRRVTESELVYPSEVENARVKWMIDHLVKARLLVKGQELGESYVEPAHDFLIRAWDELLKWSNQNRESLVLRQRLTLAAKDWKTGEGALWTAEGERLDFFGETIKSKNNWLNQIELEFVKNSIQSREDELLRAKQQIRVASAQALAALAPRQHDQLFKQDERAALMARQAFLFNEQNEGHLLSQVDETLRLILDIPYFSCVLPDQTVVENWDETKVEKWEKRSISFSHDSRYLAAGGTDKVIRVWDMKTPGVMPFFLKGHEDWVNSIAFSPNFNLLASGSDDLTIRIWNLDSLNLPPKTLAHQKTKIRSILFSPDGKKLASGGWDGTIFIWDLQQLNEPLLILHKHKGPVFALAFSPDGVTLASGSNGETVRIWNLESSNDESVLLGGQENDSETGEQSSAIAFSPDGKILVTGGSFSSTRIWSLENIKTSLRDLPVSSCNAVAFSPGGKTIATTTQRGVLLWFVDQLDKQPDELLGHLGHVRAVTFSPDGQFLATGGSDGIVRRWELQQRNKTSTIFQGHQNSINSISYNSSLGIFATASSDATIKLWNLNTLVSKSAGSEPVVLQAQGDGSEVLALSSDGSLLASTGGKQSIIRILYLQKIYNNPLFLEGSIAWVKALAFSPNGEKLASGGAFSNYIEVWTLGEPENPPVVLSGHEDGICSVKFSIDSSKLISASLDRTIRIWNLEYPDREPIILNAHSDRVWALDISADGKILASGSRDKKICLWNLENLEEPLFILRGHDDGVSFVTFSPDGNFLASAGKDNTVLIWDLQRPQDIPIAFTGLSQEVNSLTFNADGSILLGGSRDAKIYIWFVKTEHLANMVCEKVLRNLSQDEWDQFIGLGISHELTCPNLSIEKMQKSYKCFGGSSTRSVFLSMRVCL